MLKTNEEDIGEFIFVCFICVVFFGGILAIIFCTSKQAPIPESDSYVLLTSGKNTNIYYANRSTVKITENGACISFIDNSTSKPVEACTQFTIKAH